MESPLTITTDPDSKQPAGASSPPTTRRNFIVWYLGGLMTAIGVVVIAPLLVYLYPPAGANKKQYYQITLNQPLSSISPDSAVKFQAPPAAGFIMKDGGGDNYPGKIGFAGFVVNVSGALTVLSSTCSHLGCQVNLTGNHFACPCHGSQFHINGTVLQGPATAPLSNYTWHRGSGANDIAVYGVALPGIG